MADSEPEDALFIEDYLDLDEVDVFDTYPSKNFFF